jgi:hypothetical protein
MELFHPLAVELRVYYSKVSPAKMYFLHSKTQAEWCEGLVHDMYPKLLTVAPEHSSHAVITHNCNLLS